MTTTSEIKAEDYQRVEHYKVVVGYLRFLITLSAASIVLLTFFLGNLVTRPELNFLVGVSLVGFVLAFVGSIVVYTVVVIIGTGGLTIGSRGEFLFKVGVTLSWAGFPVAVVCLTVFALVNLF